MSFLEAITDVTRIEEMVITAPFNPQLLHELHMVLLCETFGGMRLGSLQLNFRPEILSVGDNLDYINILIPQEPIVDSLFKEPELLSSETSDEGRMAKLAGETHTSSKQSKLSKAEKDRAKGDKVMAELKRRTRERASSSSKPATPTNAKWNGSMNLHHTSKNIVPGQEQPLGVADFQRIYANERRSRGSNSNNPEAVANILSMSNADRIFMDEHLPRTITVNEFCIVRASLCQSKSKLQ